MVYLGNSFSIQMLAVFPANIRIEETTPEEIATSGFESVIGHPDTAAVVASILGVDVAYNRAFIKVSKKDTLYVAQVMGGRLPEGTTVLPEGMDIKFLKVIID